MPKKLLLLPALCCLIGSAAQTPEYPLFKLLHQAAEINADSNTILSPWGLQQCYGMVYAGAGQKSKKELEELLGINASSSEKFRQDAQSLKKTTASLNSFCAIAVEKQYKIQQNFLRQTKQNFNGHFFQFDLSSKADSAAALNSIARKETRGMFPEPFSPQILENSPAMILMNLLYFQSNWQKPFKKSSTRKQTFTAFFQGKEKKYSVQMMNDTQQIPYYNDGIIHGITLNYEDPRFKMLILTTVNKQDPVLTITRSLAQKGLFHFIKNSSDENETIIKLPKLDLNSDTDLKNLFCKLGASTPFRPLPADLTGMIENKALYIDQSRQMVKLILNEDGTEAAAVTFAAIAVGCAMQPVKTYNHFHADHPFVLLLFDNTTGAVLLSGIICRP